MKILVVDDETPARQRLCRLLEELGGWQVCGEAANGRQALLLPDLEGVETPEQQLDITCRKGGIDAGRDQYQLFRFRVERHH